MMRRANISSLRATALALAAALCVSAPAVLAAQQNTPVGASTVGAAVTRARGMIDKGEGGAARVLLDSLVTAQDGGSDELAEALYWRAVLAENASEAERDWQRLVIEATLSPRVPDALLWLGELELVRGHGPAGRALFTRLVRDFPDAPQRARADLWIARSLIEDGDRTNGCARVTALRNGLAEGELRLQADELASRCTVAAPVPAPPVATEPVTAPPIAASSAASGRFTVQLAAFGTKREAESAVKRLARAGITARIDGTRRPFRVRTGRYATRAEATKAIAALRKKGQKGIVAEIPR